MPSAIGFTPKLVEFELFKYEEERRGEEEEKGRLKGRVVGLSEL